MFWCTRGCLTLQEVVSDLAQYDPTVFSDWLSSLNEGRVRVALGALWAEHKECMKNIEVITSPVKDRAVVTKGECGPNAIKLVPLSTVIATKKVDEQLVEKAIRVDPSFTNKATGVKYSCVLVPAGGSRLQAVVGGGASSANVGFSALKPVAESFVVPFWFVQHVTDPAAANMHIEKVTVEGVTLPIMTNKKAVKQGAKLTIYNKPAAPKRQLAAPAPKRQKVK